MPTLKGAKKHKVKKSSNQKMTIIKDVQNFAVSG